MIYAPILQMICIWIAGISATAVIALSLAIAVAASDKCDQTNSLPQPGKFMRLCERAYVDEYGFGRDVGAEKDPYLEYGEADVEVLLS